MSRSRRHTPIHPNSCKESDKRDKQRANRRHRVRVRSALADGGGMEGAVLPHPLESDNRCFFSKHGKHYLLNSRDHRTMGK